MNFYLHLKHLHSIVFYHLLIGNKKGFFVVFSATEMVCAFLIHVIESPHLIYERSMCV
nr:MAG TPA: hypothetical protein [Caudoviricetes sp.]DAR30209.1 MAG TPA: hypothetical protein [Caudoviricetes sp.]DAW53822.1 MAG TPA: hypothetical protein [Caudoviricetes sp.]